DALFFFFFQAEDGIRDPLVTGVQTCALPILRRRACQGIVQAANAAPLAPAFPYAIDFAPTSERLRRRRGDVWLARAGRSLQPSPELTRGYSPKIDHTDFSPLDLSL